MGRKRRQPCFVPLDTALHRPLSEIRGPDVRLAAELLERIGLQVIHWHCQACDCSHLLVRSWQLDQDPRQPVALYRQGPRS